jgi:hypothetical protein
MIRIFIPVTLGIHSLIAAHPECTGGDRDHAGGDTKTVGIAGKIGVAGAARAAAAIIAALMASAVRDAFVGATEAKITADDRWEVMVTP